MAYPESLPITLISIHAPVKGATTLDQIIFNYGGKISIHAPVKGATGGRRMTATEYLISIHAPVKGATHI